MLWQDNFIKFISLTVLSFTNPKEQQIITEIKSCYYFELLNDYKCIFNRFHKAV